LARLEKEEEQGYRRLEAALANGNAVAIDAAQTYWLRVAETLRRLDRELEISRRGEEQMISLKEAQDTITYCAEWLRISIATFLSSETSSLMAIKDGGEFWHYFGQRLKGILDLVVRNADRTNSAIPDWAKDRIKTAWNVQEVQEPAAATSGPAA